MMRLECSVKQVWALVRTRTHTEQLKRIWQRDYLTFWEEYRKPTNEYCSDLGLQKGGFGDLGGLHQSYLIQQSGGGIYLYTERTANERATSWQLWPPEDMYVSIHPSSSFLLDFLLFLLIDLIQPKAEGKEREYVPRNTSSVKWVIVEKFQDQISWGNAQII